MTTIKYIEINKVAGEGLAFETRVAVPDVELTSPDRMRVTEAWLAGTALPAKRGVTLDGGLRAELEMRCSRCLEPMATTISTRFLLLIVPEALEYGSHEAELRPDDAALFYAAEGKADLAEIAAEQIFLSLPMKPVCEPGCRGLCPTCGSLRKRIECGCQEEEIDPRLAPLLKLREQEREG